ncbi:MAG: thiamine phosphate synthase [Alphaproteobacteria bacterium]
MTLTSAARLLNLRNAPSCIRRRPRLPPLLLITDGDRLPDPTHIVSRLPAGSFVIFRHYQSGERIKLAEALASLCRRRRLKFLVGNNARLAFRVRADGVHYAEAVLTRAQAIHRAAAMRRAWIVTASAHSLPALRRAARFGADAALLGPVFKTESHPGRPGLGPIRFANLARQSPIPVYALGGITDRNAGRVAGSKASGLAALGAFLESGRFWNK